MKKIMHEAQNLSLARIFTAWFPSPVYGLSANRLWTGVTSFIFIFRTVFLLFNFISVSLIFLIFL